MKYVNVCEKKDKNFNQKITEKSMKFQVSHFFTQYTNTDTKNFKKEAKWK